MLISVKLNFPPPYPKKYGSYRVRVNNIFQTNWDRKSIGPKRLCNAGEIIIHCKKRAQASRRENAVSQRRAICCRACSQLNFPRL